MNSLTRDAFLGPGRPVAPIETVALPALGGAAAVRGMTVAEFDAFLDQHRETSAADFRVRLLISGVCDDQGALLFSAADAPALAALPATAIEPAVAAVLRLNGMTEQSREEIRKNSESGPN